MYRVEPPDVLHIEVDQNVSQANYSLKTGDTVLLTVNGTFADEPIDGEYQVAVGGVINLGYSYGAVEVAGLTVRDAAILIDSHLRHHLRAPQISISLRSVAQTRRIAGQYMIVSDGTISLDSYGSVSVVGKTLDEIRETIAEHLSDDFSNPRVSVSVHAFNSKVYYIVTQGGGMGDGLLRFPCTGNETVMDALSQINGLSYVSSTQMWIARPDRAKGTSQILPVDWDAVTQRAEVETNYQLMPGDRLYIAQDRLVALDGNLAKLTAPFERVFRFTLLGTGTLSRFSGKVLSNNNDVSLFTPVY
jgi:polysaccharide export outer membrane protein